MIETHQFLPLGNLGLHYLDVGEGEPVVLLHGAPGSLGDWEPLTQRLARDHRVLVFDRGGHGLSPGQAWADARPSAHAWLLHEACQKLQVERPTVVAHSYGCAVALAWAVMHPEDLRALVLLAPVGDALHLRALQGLAQLTAWGMALPEVGSLLVQGLGAALARPLAWSVIELAFWPEPVDPVYQARAMQLWSRPSNLVAAVADFAALGPGLADLADLAPARAIPTLIVEGAQDLLVGPGPGNWLRRNLPQARSVCFAECGHMLQYSRTQEVLGLIRSLPV